MKRTPHERLEAFGEEPYTWMKQEWPKVVAVFALALLSSLLGLGLIISMVITTLIALALTCLVPWKDENDER